MKKTQGIKKGVKLNRWTEREIEYLKNHYPSSNAKEVAKALYRTVRAVHVKAAKLGIRSERRLESNNGSFKKGHTPWNKGRRVIVKNQHTWFKKGQKVWSEKPVGTIWVRKEKEVPYKFIKTEAGIRRYSRVLWEQHYGKIPKGNIIRYKDGNTLNCDIDNLLCVSRKEHARMNARPKQTARTKAIKSAGGYINALLMGKI